MLVALVNGSPHKNGSTTFAFKEEETSLTLHPVTGEHGFKAICQFMFDRFVRILA